MRDPVHTDILLTVLRVVVKNAGALSSDVLVALIAGLLALVSVISIAIRAVREAGDGISACAADVVEET